MKSSNAERRRPIPLLSATAFARLLDVAPSTVTSWIHEGMPTRSKVRGGRAAQIALADALPWVLRRSRSIMSQQERLFAAKAENVEQTNAETRRNLLRTSDVAQAFARLAEQLEGLHADVASSAAPDLAAIADPALLRAQCLSVMRDVRSKLCDRIEIYAASLASKRAP